MSEQPLQPDNRKTALENWARNQLGQKFKMQPINGDASNRRYFRLRNKQQSWMAMDAPPGLEDCRPFLNVTARLRQAGLHAPEVLADDLEQGFLLLEDLGDDLYRDVVKTGAIEAHYRPIFVALLRFADSVDASELPEYNHPRLQQELDFFTDWYAPNHCNLPLTASELNGWQTICRRLTDTALAQPQAFVHRDFHSCNVLHTRINGPGIIDYQDAVRGPITYDLVSWILDRYIDWPRAQVIDWYQQHRLCLQQNTALTVNASDWLRWCDWMGLQRNLKVLGIFARLAYRDGKHRYIKLMPRFYQYLMETATLYPETQPLIAMLEQRPCVR